MMRRTSISAIVAIALVAAVTPAPAHHSFSAEFDVTKPFKLTGIITKVSWANPHTFFYIDVTDQKTGKVTNWSMEMGNPNALMREGWTRSTMKIGDTVSVEGSLARDGSAYGNARVVVLVATGQRLFTGSSQP